MGWLDRHCDGAGVGWITGTITEANRDGRQKVKGVPANFIVHYSDETNGAGMLSIDPIMACVGEIKEHGRWVIDSLAQALICMCVYITSIFY